MEVGVENVVQVIIANASNYVFVGKMLEDKHHTIFSTTCIAHCLDLILEDIGKLDWMNRVVDQTKTMNKFIYNLT
jgi:hypothetical protein